MNTFKSFAIRTVALSALAAATLSSANAAVFFRTRVIVAPVAPVVVAPIVAAPVVAAPVVVAPVVAAPVVVVPICRFVSVPVVNAWTGITYLVTRRVCN
jgi:pyruvate dehydrogenase E2 component (dihydrolipoamide acetyltransferase)